MQTKTLVFAALTAVLLSLSGCSNARYYSETDPSVNFRIYHTFALIEEQHRIPVRSRNNADILEATIEQALDNEMQRRQYTVDETTPDLLIKYSIEMDADTKLVSQPVYRSQPMIAVAGAWRPRYYVTRNPMMVGNITRTTTKREGVLIIDVINRVTGKVIWHGWSEEPIQSKDELVTALADNVHDIMKAYPIPAL
jgi:hypothetical protein